MFDTTPDQELASCCRKGDLTRATELLAYGVRPDGGQGGRTYLAIACEAGRADIVDLLLGSGATATAGDFVRGLRSASLRIAVRIAEQLDADGVEYDFWTDDRPLLTDPAFLKGAPTELVRWMLQHGADPTERDRFDNDASTSAEKAGASEEVVTLLRQWPRNP